MSTSKAVVVVAAAAAIVFSLTIASAANAAGWWVNGSLLTSTAAIAPESPLDGELTFNIPTISVRFHCLGPFLDNGVIRTPLWIDDKGATDHRCLSLTAGCTVPDLVVFAAVLWHLLRATGTTNKVELAPSVGKLLAEIEFTGATCPLEGIQPLKGQVALNNPNGTTESVKQIFEGIGSVENNSLELGSGNKAFIEKGNILLSLLSGAKWSYH